MYHYPEAQFIVRVRAREVFPNCPRYVHKYRLVERSQFVPKANCPTPVPDWKRSEWAKGVLSASIRQIAETVYDKLHNTFGLRGERGHELSGLQARLAARVALHNFCIRLNEQLGRYRLSFADLLQW
jgi:hypothetical protein